jgi:hypothetical protein
LLDGRHGGKLLWGHTDAEIGNRRERGRRHHERADDDWTNNRTNDRYGRHGRHEHDGHGR